MNDFWFALRQVRRHPGFTAVAVLTLALGIGGNTAMFSIVNALLFKPLDLPQAAGLVRCYSPQRSLPDQYRGVSYPNYVDLGRESQVFSQLAATVPFQVSLAEGESARQVFVDAVSANYFATVGVGLWRGREFTVDEERDGHQPAVVIISHRFWQGHGADPEFLGRTLQIAGKPHTIIGITPEGFTGHSALVSAEFWLPLCRAAAAWRCSEQDLTGDRKKLQVLALLGRLGPGIGLVEANSQMTVHAAQLRAAYPGENDELELTVGPLPRFSFGYGPGQPAVFAGLSVILMSLSGIVLLVAGWNVANLLLARAATRRPEMAVRVALGGGRARIVCQLLIEGLVLALLGGMAGWVASIWCSRLLIAGASTFLPGLQLAAQSTLDPRVLLATLAFCGLATLLFALSPAWAVVRAVGVNDLREQVGRRDLRVGGLGVFSGRSGRVIGQLGLCLALLTVAALILRSVHHSLGSEAGFPLDHRLVLEVSPGLENREVQTYPALFERIMTRLTSIPGIEAVGSSISLPFRMTASGIRVRPAERAGLPNQDRPIGDEPESTGAVLDFVTRGYFVALGLPLQQGRTFEPGESVSRDAASSTQPVVVDDVLARALWPGRDPLGRCLEAVAFTRERKSAFFEVVGVVPGVRQQLTDSGLAPHLYIPLKPTAAFGTRYFVVKTASSTPGGEARVAHDIWRALRGGPDPAPLMSVKTLQAHRDENPNLVATRVIARLLLGFGLLATALAVSGLYGVTAYTVACRTREFGVRLALGATRRNIFWLVQRQGLFLTVLGVAVGLGLGWGVAKLLSTEFYALRTFDWSVYVGLPAVLGTVVALACWLPARRAAHLDPAAALRAE